MKLNRKMAISYSENSNRGVGAEFLAVCLSGGTLKMFSSNYPNDTNDEPSDLPCRVISDLQYRVNGDTVVPSNLSKLYSPATMRRSIFTILGLRPKGKPVTWMRLTGCTEYKDHWIDFSVGVYEGDVWVSFPIYPNHDLIIKDFKIICPR